MGKVERLVLCAVSDGVLGLSMGFASRAVLEAARTGGHLAALSMGLGFSQMVDPMTGQSSTAVADLLAMMAFGFFVVLGGHRDLIVWLTRSVVGFPQESCSTCR